MGRSWLNLLLATRQHWNLWVFFVWKYFKVFHLRFIASDYTSPGLISWRFCYCLSPNLNYYNLLALLYCYGIFSAFIYFTTASGESLINYLRKWTDLNFNYHCTKAKETAIRTRFTNESWNETTIGSRTWRDRKTMSFTVTAFFLHRFAIKTKFRHVRQSFCSDNNWDLNQNQEKQTKTP